MAHGRARQIIFRIFYSTSFTVVFLLTITFACAGPIDAFYQSYRRGRLVDIVMLAGIYVLTGVLAILMYASRLYTNRSLLKDIPKSYMPIDKYELPGKRVWRLIEDCKSRSAVIAHQARPRARRVENELPHARERINTLLRPARSKDDNIFEPQWGTISHPGWSSPAATETPNLSYAAVVAELTDLIEARAVSLAPTQPRPTTATTTASESELFVEPFIIEALRRPEEIGMRQYVSQLIDLAVLEETSLTTAFLTLYERARFAPEPLSEAEFKALMRMFAEILRNMHTLDITRLEFPDEYNDLYDDESDIVRTSPSTKQQQPKEPVVSISRNQIINRNNNDSTSSIAETTSLAGSIRHHSNALSKSLLNDGPPPRVSEDYPRSLSSSLDHHDNDMYTDARDNWATVTSRPPFLHPSQSPSPSTSKSHSRSRKKNTSHSRSRNLTSRIADRSRSSRLSLARLARRGSTVSGSGAVSMRSARSQGSVIRLVDSREGEREGRVFEFIEPENDDRESDRGPPRD